MAQPHLPKIHRRPQHDANRTNTTGGYPLHQTRQSPTTVKEKKPHLLWKEQTRDTPTKVQRIDSANPCAKSDARCADNQRRETPHRPHDTRSSTLKVVEHLKLPLRLAIGPSRSEQSTKTTTFRGRRPEIPPLPLELQCRMNRQPVAQATLVEIEVLAPVCNLHLHRFCNWCKASGTKVLSFSTGCITNRC
jgi:hypothetical protein